MLSSLPAPDRDDIAAICTALELRFGDVGREAIRQAELFARRRLPGESISELGDAIVVLADKAFPGAAVDIRNLVGTRAFLEALPVDLRRRVGDHEPQTVLEAVRKAVVLEARDLADEARGPTLPGVL